MLTAYIDESCNNRTFCVGGWLAPDEVWTDIAHLWQQRIEYERRKSIIKGFAPISRYHASDCSNFKKEFAREKGWDEKRQVRLTRRIIQMLSDAKPAGIVMGGGIEDYLRYFTGDRDRWKEGLYYFATIMCLYHIADLVEGSHPNERVSVVYERGNFGGMAEKAFSSLMDDPRNRHVAKYFVKMIPMGWENCVPLQSADFIAYEGFKRIDGSLNDRETVRKSMQALVGKGITLIIGHFSDKTFRHMVERKKKELSESGLLEGDGGDQP